MKKILLIGSSVVLLLMGIVLLLSFQKQQFNILHIGAPTPTPAQIPSSRTTAPPLQVVAVSPISGATNVPIDTPIVITFNRPFNENEIYFSLAPQIEHTLSTYGTMLIATPSSPLNTATLYSYIVYPLADNTQAQTVFFSTPGYDSNTSVDTRPYRISEDADTNLMQTNPDVFLANNTPYQTTDFSITNAFVNNHFSFMVSPNTSATKKLLHTWLISLGLTEDEIAKLDIQYQ